RRLGVLVILLLDEPVAPVGDAVPVDADSAPAEAVSLLHLCLAVAGADPLLLFVDHSSPPFVDRASSASAYRTADRPDSSSVSPHSPMRYSARSRAMGVTWRSASSRSARWARRASRSER